ncbi:protein ROS1-like [Carica papaya]|uniref:protein ROS1-like n=1 Tax=Carica papaya TaxID=3649 RepID=UPI000B8CACBA|nr:protein ROS1-like [Carica papaya]
MNELSTSDQHFYDLNFPPGTTANKVPNKIISEFAPITPEKGKRVEGRQLSETVNLCSEGINQEGNKEGTKANNPDRIECSNELTQPITDFMLAQPSRENHNPDMGGSHDTEINKTPQQKPKRRKHRPKVVTEHKPKRTPKSAATNTDSKENQTPKPKRKYVRKKPLNKDSTPLPAEAGGESYEPKTLRSIKKSARRSLNFDKEEQPRDENSTCVSTFNLHSDVQAQNRCNKENLAQSTTQLPDRVEVMVENIQKEGNTCNLFHALNQALPASDGQAPSTPLPAKTNPPRRRKRNAPSQKENNEGETGQLIIKSQEDMMRIISHLDTQPRGPDDKDSTSTLVTEEGQANRYYSRATDPANTCITKEIGVRYDMLQAYERMSWVHFPNSHKKKRTEKGQHSTTSSASSSITALTTFSGQESRVDPSMSTTNCWISSQSDANGVPTSLEEAQQSGLQDKVQSIECIRGIIQSEKFTKKRSRGIYRARDSISLSRIVDCNMYLNYPGGHTLAQCDRQESNNSPRSHPNIEAIVANMQSTLARKKRTKKRNTFVNPTLPRAKDLQMHHRIALNDHRTTPEVLWNQMSIEAISEQLKLLDINREGNHIPCQEQNAITLYKMGNPEQNALVLYRRDGTLVPFYPIKKRRPRPKVDLDDETNRGIDASRLGRDQLWIQ